VIDVPTMQGWLIKLGFEAVLHERPKTLQIRQRPDDQRTPALPPFFVQCTEHWVLLSMLPMFVGSGPRPEELYHRLISANRDMRIAKFAIDKNSNVVLCVELPTESLDYSELADAVARMVEYARRYMTELSQR
jgi:hypothetical protein